MLTFFAGTVGINTGGVQTNQTTERRGEEETQGNLTFIVIYASFWNSVVFVGHVSYKTRRLIFSCNVEMPCSICFQLEDAN